MKEWLNERSELKRWHFLLLMFAMGMVDGVIRGMLQ